MTNSIRCFVASAFDHKDVDAIFDKGIRPVLRELGCTPLRVDRVEHNDDIDNKIFALIDSCQLCIADLTYARPSVYYEAGYAFGTGKQVIYIARKDHFEKQPDDVSGNLQVHFDLKMKNIIDWSTPNEAFKKRLRSRVRHVTKPLRQLQLINKQRDESAREFAAYSLNMKHRLLAETTSKFLIGKGFRPLKPAETYAQVPIIHMTRQHGATLQIFHAFAMPSITQKKIRDFRMVAVLSREDGRRDAPSLELFLLFATSTTVRSSTLANAMPNFDPVASRAGSVVSGIHRRPPLEKDLVAVIDGTRSIDEYRERLDQLWNDVQIG